MAALARRTTLRESTGTIRTDSSSPPHRGAPNGVSPPGPTGLLAAASRRTESIILYPQNCNRASAGYGQLLWFGVPLYDDRVRIPNAHRAQDVGKDDASGMFIFTVAGKEFTSQSLHDMQWVTIDKELLPFMREGLTTAWQAGFLQDSQDLADYRITSMNLGWEVPGVFNVEMQYRNLSLMVSTTPKTH
ncbi:MAG: hypothetical protein R3C56_20990 [Pirellulaceae bacterium]